MSAAWRELPSRDDDPDANDPKGFIQRHSFPELHGPTRTAQLKKKLGDKEFKRIRIVRPEGGLRGVWNIEMYSDISQRPPTTEEILAEIVQIGWVLGFQLDHAGAEVSTVGRRITVSFCALL
jgi:hypothetical protein